MTREEAIEIIKRYDVNFCDNDGNPISAELLSQAFDMAIKSLEAWEKVREEIELVTKFGNSYEPIEHGLLMSIIDKHLKGVSE